MKRRLQLLMGPFTPLFWVVILISSCFAAGSYKGLHLDKIKMPPGFKIDVYIENIPDARSMTLSPGGTLFVGTRKKGTLYAVPDRNGDHTGDAVFIVARGLYMPNGVAFRDGDLYVAEVNRIIRFNDIESQLNAPPEPEVINDQFPAEAHHGWKYIAFGPDEKLYVPVGAPCNVCQTDDQRFASIMRMNSDGRNLEIFVRGVRNTVGFDWHPKTGELWFTNNGRDWMGDDLPPDTLHRAPGGGLHFGFPYCHAGDIPDPEFGKIRSCSEFDPPAFKLQAHAAPLGMKFYTGKMFPAGYKNQIFIAEHGSWNRSVPVGYRVMRVTLEGNRPVRYEMFAEGWLQGDKAWGRPVDILVMPDGALLVSDDRAGVVYRINYEE